MLTRRAEGPKTPTKAPLHTLKFKKRVSLDTKGFRSKPPELQNNKSQCYNAPKKKNGTHHMSKADTRMCRVPYTVPNCPCNPPPDVHRSKDLKTQKAWFEFSYKGALEVTGEYSASNEQYLLQSSCVKARCPISRSHGEKEGHLEIIDASPRWYQAGQPCGKMKRKSAGYLSLPHDSSRGEQVPEAVIAWATARLDGFVS